MSRWQESMDLALPLSLFLLLLNDLPSWYSGQRSFVVEVGSVRDFRLLWCSGDLRSSGLLRSVGWLVTDVSGELTLCIFKGQDLDPWRWDRYAVPKRHDLDPRRWDWCAVPKRQDLDQEGGIFTLSRNVTILTLTDEICTLSRNVSTNQPTLCINPKEQKSEGGSSGNALDLYSRNTRFKSWLGHCPFWGFFFSFSAALLGKCLDISSN